MQLGAARVDDLRAGHVIEIVTFDGVHEGLGFAGLRDQVEPPPRGEVSGAAHSREAVRHRVGSLEIIEEPCIEAIGFEGSLDGADIDGHIRPDYNEARTGRRRRASYNLVIS